MLKESKGNMYPWVTYTHTHLGGECEHKCVYCYVDNPRWGRPERYTGKIRLIEQEFKVNYGEGKVIFIENCNDLFAKGVPAMMIERVIAHCRKYPNNTYVFQSKNPARFFEFDFGLKAVFGTTVESNRDYPNIGKGPSMEERISAMRRIRERSPEIRLFLTIEPVLDFDVVCFAGMIGSVKPDFINLGADSKGHGLPEPSVEKIRMLVEELKKYGVELREKHNLARLK